jgi:predicted ATP-grasp superfamily ATP-dependent carboligase
MSCIRKNYNKKILTEAHNLSDHLIGCFLKDKDLKKIHVIRNFKNSKLKDNRIQYHYVSENNPQDKVFQSLDIKDMILIAPESNQINIKIFKKFNKKFNLLNSNYNVHKLFSSKKKLMKYYPKKKFR